MSGPDPSHLELAALIREALALADRLRLVDVGIGLDQAMVSLSALDASGTIVPVPFDLDSFERGPADMGCDDRRT